MAQIYNGIQSCFHVFGDLRIYGRKLTAVVVYQTTIIRTATEKTKAAKIISII